jgi:hypothetical protein
MRYSYVRTDHGEYLIQIDDAELFPRWGFALSDGEFTWEGGFGAPATSWEVVPEDKVPIERRRELEAVL